jgi:hypothetical protein
MSAFSVTAPASHSTSPKDTDHIPNAVPVLGCTPKHAVPLGYLPLTAVLGGFQSHPHTLYRHRPDRDALAGVGAADANDTALANRLYPGKAVTAEFLKSNLVGFSKAAAKVSTAARVTTLIAVRAGGFA